ncbi:MAG: hypothetical protein CMF61_08195 [Magnetococcales bacterium]|nr:hypothetical protein [Magnetococcales bacterium]PPR19584.1 MAG: hypothetical protein CFH43_00105 [Pseudomonadota bacterium]|tara:strand:+ start:137 stop:694 length:558 start_codon:yes stop_codon:yes gene_type:complete
MIATVNTLCDALKPYLNSGQPKAELLPFVLNNALLLFLQNSKLNQPMSPAEVSLICQQPGMFEQSGAISPKLRCLLSSELVLPEDRTIDNFYFTMVDRFQKLIRNDDNYACVHAELTVPFYKLCIIQLWDEVIAKRARLCDDVPYKERYNRIATLTEEYRMTEFSFDVFAFKNAVNDYCKNYLKL